MGWECTLVFSVEQEMDYSVDISEAQTFMEIIYTLPSFIIFSAECRHND